MDGRSPEIPNLLLIPLIYFPLGLKSVAQLCAVLATTLMPQLMGAPGNLFFQAHALVHVQSGHADSLA